MDAALDRACVFLDAPHLQARRQHVSSSEGGGVGWGWGGYVLMDFGKRSSTAHRRRVGVLKHSHIPSRDCGSESDLSCGLAPVRQTVNKHECDYNE